MTESTNAHTPLAGVRIIECSMLGPGAITTHLADLGAEVIKVEPPSGDYIRQMTWPIVEGVSLMHLHISRGKRSITLDLRTAEGREVFLDLVRDADCVVEAMRPGGLAKRGLKRMFLHAARFRFEHPLTRERIDIEAPLPEELARFLERLEPAAKEVRT